jgi:hypothetical protein
MENTEIKMVDTISIGPGWFAQFAMKDPKILLLPEGVSSYRFGFMPVVCLGVFDEIDPDTEETHRWVIPMVAGHDGMILRADEQYVGDTYHFLEYFLKDPETGEFKGLHKHPSNDSAYWVRSCDCYRINA